jgi:hypothetical protein
MQNVVIQKNIMIVKSELQMKRKILLDDGHGHVSELQSEKMLIV